MATLNLDESQPKKKNPVHPKKEAVPKPNAKDFRDEMLKHSETIDKLRKRILELNQNINEGSAGREEFNRKKDEIKTRLNQLQQQETKIESERKALIEMIDIKQKESKEMKTNLLNLKKTIGYTSGYDIDRKIKELESTMMISTLPLKEEKRIMAEIAQLKSNRPLVGKFTTMENSALIFEGNSIAPLRSQLEKVCESLTNIKSLRREESEKLKSLISRRNKVLESVKHLFEERDQINKEISLHLKKRRELQDELHIQMEKYNLYMNEVMALRNEKIKEDKRRKATEAERISIVRRLERAEEIISEDENLLLQQTINFIQKLIIEKQLANNNLNPVKDDEENVEENKKDPIGDESRIADVVAILPKKDREEEFYFAPKGKKCHNKKSQKPKEKSKALKLDIAILSTLEQCGVDPPVCYDDLTICLNKLVEKLEENKSEQLKRKEEYESQKRELEAQLEALNNKQIGFDSKQVVPEYVST